MQPGNETALCFSELLILHPWEGHIGAQLYRAEPVVLAIPLEGSFTMTFPGSGPVIQESERSGHKLEG